LLSLLFEVPSPLVADPSLLFFEEASLDDDSELDDSEEEEPLEEPDFP